MLKLAIAILFLIPNVTLGATIYIDGQLAVNCSSNNYSIANRTCTGKDGNAYNNIQPALTASAANDTIYFRPGTYTAPTGATGIAVKNAQTWAMYPGDTARSATINANGDNTNLRVFTVYGGFGANNVIIRDLTINGGKLWGIQLASTNSSKVINNEIRNFCTTSDSGNAGVAVVAWDTQNSSNVEVTDNYIHTSICRGVGFENADHGGVVVVGDGNSKFYVSNALIARNNISEVDFGIWMDVQACRPGLGATPCTIEENYVHDTDRHCLHEEVGSTGVWRKNICYNNGEAGIFMRPGASTNTSTKIYNNTFYNYGTNIRGNCIWIYNDQNPTNLTNLEVKNNICYRNGAADSFWAITVGALTIGETTNRYQNNLLHIVANNNGICWGISVNNPGGGCDAALRYADTSAGISSWQAAAPSGVASGNIAGDPILANPAGGDFRLCTAADVPHASCTGKSPAIDAGVNVGLSFQGTAPDLGAIESGASSGGVPLAPTVLKLTSP
jgi:Right handed beta helix region